MSAFRALRYYNIQIILLACVVLVLRRRISRKKMVERARRMAGQGLDPNQQPKVVVLDMQGWQATTAPGFSGNPYYLGRCCGELRGPTRAYCLTSGCTTTASGTFPVLFHPRGGYAQAAPVLQ